MVVATVVMLVILAVLTAFQIALAAGAPWGAAAYGGVWPGVLPKGIRINSLVFGLVIYPLIGLYVIDRGGLAAFDWLPARGAAIWVLVAFFAIGAVLNLISRSKVERLWAPVAFTASVCALVLALV